MPYVNSTDAMDFANDCAAQVDRRFGAVVYANGSLSFSGASIPTDFKLPTRGTAVGAAQQIADGCLNFYKSGTVSGIPGAPTNGGLSVVSGQIFVDAIVPIIQSKLLPYFDTRNSGKDTFEGEFDGAIDDAIAAITTLHIELMQIGLATVPTSFPGTASG